MSGCLEISLERLPLDLNSYKTLRVIEQNRLPQVNRQVLVEVIVETLHMVIHNTDGSRYLLRSKNASSGFAFNQMSLNGVQVIIEEDMVKDTSGGVEFDLEESRAVLLACLVGLCSAERLVIQKG